MDRERVARIIFETHYFNYPECLRLADKIIAEEGKDEKPYTLSHGIGLSGKVEELIITLPKQPQQPKLPTKEEIITIICRNYYEPDAVGRLAQAILDYLKAKE